MTVPPAIEPATCRTYRLTMRGSLFFYKSPQSEQGTAITRHELELLVDFSHGTVDPTWATRDLHHDALTEPLYSHEARAYLQEYAAAHAIDVSTPSPCWPLW
jgi:hypothetical protein